MRNSAAVTVGALFFSAPVLAQHAIEWQPAAGGNGHWYGLISAVDSCAWWECQQAHCIALGGHLATAGSTPELHFIATLAGGTYCALGGRIFVTETPDGNCVASAPQWITGEQWPPEFGPGTFQCPFDMYSYLAGTQLTWASAPLAFSSHSICEWASDCNGDGKVDFGQCLSGQLADFDGNHVPDCCEQDEPCVAKSYPVQWRAADGGNGHWYQVMTQDSAVSWQEAREIARSVGGDLAVITSVSGMSFLSRLSALTPNAWRPADTSWVGPWIGALQAEGSAEPSNGWAWVDGSSVDTTVIRATLDNATECSVNEDRLCLWKFGSTPVNFLTSEFSTNDFPATGQCFDQMLAPKSFIIEWSADCNGDGIVDKGQILSNQLNDLSGDGVPDICDGASAVQWRPQDGGNGHWFMLVPLGLEFNDWPNPLSHGVASMVAAEMGGHLATATSIAELSFIRTASLTTTSSCWLGGVSGWTDHPSNAYAGWLTGEPWLDVIERYRDPCCCCMNMCLAIERGTLSWAGFEFYGAAPMMLVEWSNDCNGDGIVDFGQCISGALVDANRNFRPDCCESKTECVVQSTCPCDLLRDGVVDGADLGVLLSEWGPSSVHELADLNQDGVVNGADLGTLLGSWGACP